MGKARFKFVILKRYERKRKRMENKRPKQCERILKYMQDFGSITQFEALKDLGVMRLASRISEMKLSGYAIEKKMEKGLNRYKEPYSYARYRLVK
jgi:hypothetical protein